MQLKNILRLAIIVGILSYPLATRSETSVLRTVQTDCLHPIRGREVCTVTVLPSPDEQMEITWETDNTITKVRSLDVISNAQVWNEQENTWSSISSLGVCFEYKCVSIPIDQVENSNLRTFTSECWHPVRGEGLCSLEEVPETGGMRISWPEGSTDHVIFPTNNDPPLVWSHIDNDWAELSSIGLCWDDVCVLNMLKQEWTVVEQE